MMEHYNIPTYILTIDHSNQSILFCLFNRVRQATTSAFFFSFKYSFSFCYSFHSSLPSPQALNPELFLLLSSWSSSLKQFFISSSAYFLNFIWSSNVSSVISANLMSSCTSGLLKNYSYSLLSPLQKHSSRFRFSSVNSCFDQSIIIPVMFWPSQGIKNCIDLFSPINLAYLMKLVYNSISKSILNLMMFIIVRQFEEFSEYRMSKPLQFSIHSPKGDHRNNFTRVKKRGLRGLILILIVSSRSLSNFIIMPTPQKASAYSINLVADLNQQIQMFDYNRQQKSIQGIYRINRIEKGEKSWKLNPLTQICQTKEPQFIKKIDFSSAKTNPFLEIEQTSKKQSLFVNDLDFSTISIKSPTYSEFYNSVGQDKFFQAPRQAREEIDSPRPQLNFFGRDNREQLRQAINNAKYSHEVPTFFIKMPENLRGGDREKRELQLKVKRELEDIYNGKYKIMRQQQNNQGNC